MAKTYIDSNGVIHRVEDHRYDDFAAAIPDHRPFKETVTAPVPTMGGLQRGATVEVPKSVVGTGIDVVTSGAGFGAVEKGIAATPFGRTPMGLVGRGGALALKSLGATFGRKFIGDPLKNLLDIPESISAQPSFSDVMGEELLFGGLAEGAGALVRMTSNYLKSGKDAKEAHRLIKGLNEMGVDNATIGMVYADPRLIEKEVNALKAYGTLKEGEKFVKETTEQLHGILEDLSKYGYVTQAGEEAARKVGRAEMGGRELVAARKAVDEKFDRARGYFKFANEFIPKSLSSKDLDLHKFIKSQSDPNMSGYAKFRRMMAPTRVKGSEVDKFIEMMQLIDKDPKFPGIDYALLDKIRREIGTVGKAHFNKFVPDTETSAYFDELYRIVNDDLRSMLQKIPGKEGVDALEYLEKGNKAWQEGIEMSKKFGRQFENKALFPDEIEAMVRSYAFGKNAKAQRFTKLYTEFTPNDREKFRVMFFNNMTRGANAADSVKNFYKNYRNMDDSVRNLVFGRSAHRDAVEKIARAGEWIDEFGSATPGKFFGFDPRTVLTASAGLGFGQSVSTAFGAQMGTAGYTGALAAASYTALRLAMNRGESAIIRNPKTAVVIGEIMDQVGKRTVDADINKQIFRLSNIAAESQDTDLISAVAAFTSDLYNMVNMSQEGENQNAVE